MMLRSGQEREERERLAEVIGQLEALKEELEGKVLSYEKNIRSLKSQVSGFDQHVCARCYNSEATWILAGIILVFLVPWFSSSGRSTFY